MIISIILSSFMLCSLMEYLLHKYYLHKNSGHPHISQHHVMFHGKTSYEHAEASYKDIVSNLGYITTSWLPAGLIGFIIIPYDSTLGVLFATTGLLYLIWVECSHYLFHKPHHFFIEKLYIFKQLKEHHRLHHIHYQTNFGIGSSVWDVILKTQNKI